MKATLTNLNFLPNHVMQRGAVLEAAILSSEQSQFFSSDSIRANKRGQSNLIDLYPSCKKQPSNGQILSRGTKWQVVTKLSKSAPSLIAKWSIRSRGGTRLPSECDYLQKNSSLWRLSMNNCHKREYSAVDFAAKCHP